MHQFHPMAETFVQWTLGASIGPIFVQWPRPRPIPVGWTSDRPVAVGAASNGVRPAAYNRANLESSPLQSRVRREYRGRLAWSPSLTIFYYAVL